MAELPGEAHRAVRGRVGRADRGDAGSCDRARGRAEGGARNGRRRGNDRGRDDDRRDDSGKPPPPAGDAAAGKTLFTAQGCVACHTFKPAGATAKVGPDLDNLAADAEKANRGTVEEYAAESIENPTAYTVPGYPSGVMPAFNSLSDKQVGDLVAFLTAG